MMKSTYKKQKACECNLCVHCKNNNYQAYYNNFANQSADYFSELSRKKGTLFSIPSEIFSPVKNDSGTLSPVKNDVEHKSSGKPHGNMQLRVSSFKGMMVGFGVFTAIMLLAPALLITWMPIAIAVTAGVLFAAVDYGLNRQANKNPEEQSIQKEVTATGSPKGPNVYLY
jgi:hypothetical protein